MEAVSVEPVFGWYAMVPLAIIMLGKFMADAEQYVDFLWRSLGIDDTQAARSIGIAAGMAPARFGLDIRA